MRVKRRVKCSRCPAVCITYAERPLCQGCRRELAGFSRDEPARCGTPERQRAYFRMNFRRRYAAAREA